MDAHFLKASHSMCYRTEWGRDENHEMMHMKLTVVQTSYFFVLWCSRMSKKNCSIYSIPTFPTQLNWIVASFNNFVIMFLCSSIATVFLNKCSSSLLTSLRFSLFVVQTVNAVCSSWKKFFCLYSDIFYTLSLFFL